MRSRFACAKLENHIHALSICFMHYNFVRIHQTRSATPAMEAGDTDRLWSLEDMAGIVDKWKARKDSVEKERLERTD